MAVSRTEIPALVYMREQWFRLVRSRIATRILAGVAIAALLLILIIGAFPVSLARGWVAERLSARLDSRVRIGSLTRDSFFSFSPTITIHDLRVPQPSWAGTGDMARAQEIQLRVSVLPILLGRGPQPEAIQARDLSLALVRDKSGRSNWGSKKKSGSGGRSLDLTDLSITRASFTLRDERRHLAVAGTIEAEAAKGLTAQAQGRFHEAPVTLSLRGEPIADRSPTAPYPFQLRIASPLLQFDARGRTIGALNTSDMTLAISAQAPSLKYLDDIIEAGLFGTQPINLRADVRHKGRDWFVDRLQGSVGRSRLTGQATILKRAERSKIDATVAFSQLDFDDLADEAGQAAQAALRARMGDRVLPNTRINLSKVGPTDGVIRLSAAQLLFKTPSVFRSLRGNIRLDGKVLRIDDIEATMTNGRMTGRLLVDHRSGASPRLDVDLQVREGRLGTLLGMSDRIDAPWGARIALSGRGDTIRAALAKADGQVGFVAGDGHVSRIIAAVLAQDMGKAIGAALGNGNEAVPLRCVALGFEARAGTLTARPFLIETAVSRTRGEGTISLDSERIALTLGGAARDPTGLPMVDPIRIGGTLSTPSLELTPVGGGKGISGILGAVVKSIGGALGLNQKTGPDIGARGPLDCKAISERLLTVALPAPR